MKLPIEKLVSCATKVRPLGCANFASQPAITRTLEGEFKLATELIGDTCHFSQVDKSLEPLFNTKLQIGDVIETIQLKPNSYKVALEGIDEKLVMENFLGKGVEAEVYKIDDNFVLRCLGSLSACEQSGKISCKKFHPLADIFEGRNFGQAVAVSEDGRVTINKFVSGTVLRQKLGDMSVAEYMDHLRSYRENLSNEVLEHLIKDIKFVQEKGYKIDINPNNFLYDNKLNRINLIDIVTPESKFFKRNHEINDLGLNSIFLSSVDIYRIWNQVSIEERKEIIEIMTSLYKNIKALCNKHEIKIGSESGPWLYNIMQISNKIDYERDLFTQVVHKVEPKADNDMIEFMRNLYFDGIP